MRRRELLGAAAGTLGLAALAAACGTGRGSPLTPTTTTSGARMTDVESYGDDALQVGEWFVPSAGGDRLPTVMLIHGGFWRPQYDRHLEDAVAGDLVGLGYLVWNIDYRPSTSPWPSTLGDLAAAYDHLAHGRYAHRVDRDRIAVVGHSAGGQLALWTASRHRLPDGAPGARPALRPPALAVSQAGVDALTVAAETGLGDGAAVALCHGTPTEVPGHYADADPVRLVPTGVRTLLVHGVDDDIVPLSQSELYLAAATAAGDHCTLDQVPGDHFVNVQPGTEAVDRVQQALEAMRAG